MITIVDYGMGNLGSIVNMFKRIGITTQVSASKDEIEKSTKLLLPGVGAFDSAMNCINNSGLRDVLDYKALESDIFTNYMNKVESTHLKQLEEQRIQREKESKLGQGGEQTAKGGARR